MSAQFKTFSEDLEAGAQGARISDHLRQVIERTQLPVDVMEPILLEHGVQTPAGLASTLRGLDLYVLFRDRINLKDLTGFAKGQLTARLRTLQAECSRVADRLAAEADRRATEAERRLADEMAGIRKASALTMTESERRDLMGWIFREAKQNLPRHLQPCQALILRCANQMKDRQFAFIALDKVTFEQKESKDTRTPKSVVCFDDGTKQLSVQASTTEDILAKNRYSSQANQVHCILLLRSLMLSYSAGAQHLINKHPELQANAVPIHIFMGYFYRLEELIRDDLTMWQGKNFHRLLAVDRDMREEWVLVAENHPDWSLTEVINHVTNHFESHSRLPQARHLAEWSTTHFYKAPRPSSPTSGKGSDPPLKSMKKGKRARKQAKRASRPAGGRPTQKKSPKRQTKDRPKPKKKGSQKGGGKERRSEKGKGRGGPRTDTKPPSEGEAKKKYFQTCFDYDDPEKRCARGAACQFYHGAAEKAYRDTQRS